MSNPAIYFKSLTIENIRCFKTEQTISFTEYGKDDTPAMFTVILGNNNMGKTTILKLLGDIESFVANNGQETYEEISFQAAGLIPRKKLDFNAFFGLKVASRGDIILSENHIELLKFFGEHSNVLNYSFAIDIKKSKYGHWHIADNKKNYPNFMVDAYGVNRAKGELSLSNYNLDKLQDRTESLFSDNAKLLNAEDFLLRTYISTNPNLNNAEKATNKLNKIKATILELFRSAGNTEAGNLEFISNDKLETNVFFTTEFGDKVRLNDLGAGYQSLITWVVDLAHRMFMRYPEAENPLAEPAIVLVDELDLHLHPEWQRKVVKYLRDTFEKTQFIVTAHSPLLVQSADNLNVILLQEDTENQGVKIIDANDEFRTNTFEGWTVEEIIKHLMYGKTESQKYKDLRKGFEEALDDNNYEQAKHFYDEIAKLANAPSSVESDIMQMRMTAISPNRPTKTKK